MIVYEHEAKAGLTDQIQKNTSVAFTCDINTDSIFKERDVEKTIAKISGNPNQVDLFYIDSILVSTNWNGNDDVFLKEEVWPARTTAVDKPFNYLHNEKDIIGHITSAAVLGIDGSEIDINLSVEEAPEIFDIVVGSVIYKRWDDPSLQQRMNEIIKSIENGQKFVSMEAIFRNFDYSAVSEQGEQFIIERNKDTSFLTGHLRAYGGDGIYNGNRLGRVLRNITFSGKGLVDVPANKRSRITSYSFYGTTASLKKDLGSNLMTISQAEYEGVKASYEKARLEIENLESVLAKTKAELEQIKTEADTVKASKLELESALANEKALSEQKSEKISTLEKSVAEYSETAKASQERESSLKAELVKRDRIASLLEVGVEISKAGQIADKFAAASDDMFKEVVDLHAVAGKADSEGDEQAKAEKAEKEEEEKAKKAAAELEKAKAGQEAGVSLPNNDDELMHTTATKWMSSVLNIKE